MQNIVIIGNGIAGITTARHIRKRSDAQITVISGESEYFYSRTALMYIYMGQLKQAHTQPYEKDFWVKNRIELVYDWVTKVDFNNKKIVCQKVATLTYDSLIIATGSTPILPEIPGITLAGVQGLYSIQDLDKMEASTKNIKNAVVIGGGLIGVEMSEMLHSRGIKVTHVIREQGFWGNVLPQEEAEMINQELLTHGIDLRTAMTIKEIWSEDGKTVSGVLTHSGEKIPCQFVGMAIGVQPNIQWIKGTDLNIDRGILVDEYLRTNQPDVYAIGDCAQLQNPGKHRSAIEAVWYSGKMMGETLARTITGAPTKYIPGIWFNSAKFFSKEYQVYGQIDQSGVSSFFWQSENRQHGLRIQYDSQDWSVIGAHALGIRQKHETWDNWIQNKITIAEVISRIAEACFDPEFSHSHSRSIQQAFQSQFPELEIIVKRPSLWQRIFSTTN